MVLYGTILVPLVEESRAADSGLLSPFYSDDAAFDGSAQKNAQLLKLLMKIRPDRGCFPKLAKSLFISGILGQEEAARREFPSEGIVLNFFSWSWYLSSYLGPQEELVAWVKTQVEAWAHGVRVLGDISQRHHQSVYAILGMSLQLEW